MVGTAADLSVQKVIGSSTKQIIVRRHKILVLCAKTGDQTWILLVSESVDHDFYSKCSRQMNIVSQILSRCSSRPGTGRTGTLIAVDLCMRMYEDRRRVDIQNCVHKLRSERAGAVQTKEQYTLIYEVCVISSLPHPVAYLPLCKYSSLFYSKQYVKKLESVYMYNLD